ncbi:MAG: ATP-binding protein [Nitrospirae bacterium CG17_big_fil_post_rev_8_21_14_2_50_50_9]|nr:MAG: ATP-binding protein [Nitrospirae bacterium CG17_big_fil_post_rev_8_21_14_2_50_50_9]
MTASPEWPSMLKQCVIAVGGGKGGTGKSLLAANLGIALAEMRQQVMVIDLDLGGANLHTCLGIRSPKTTLGDFLQKKVDLIEKVLIPTPMENLKLINGSNDPLEITNLPYAQKARLIHQFKKLKADYIILDLGAGTSLNILDFFLSSDYGIVVTTPEPTSIENVSLFIKCFIMRHLKILLKQFPIENLKNRIKDPRNLDTARTFRDLLRLIRSFEKETAEKIEREIEGFKFGLVMNKLREHSETRIGDSYKTMIHKCMGIQMDYLGQIYYDEKIPMSVKKIQPLLLEHPHAKASHAIRLMAKRILGMNRLSFPVQREISLFDWKKKEKNSSSSVKGAPMKTPQKDLPLGIRFYL